MSDNDVCKIIDKLQKLRALSHARERVRQLERELYGEGAKTREPPRLPEFLSQHSPLRAAQAVGRRTSEASSGRQRLV